jgi:hypothetical protein
MPKKTFLYLSFFLVCLIFPSPASAQTLLPDQYPAPTLDPSNVLVGMARDPVKVREGDGVVQIPIQLNHPAAVEVTVDLIVTGGDANVGQDYWLLTPRVVIPAGVEAAAFEIEIFDDSQEESIESAEFELMSANGAQLDYNQKTHQIKIIDNDGSWWRLNSIVELVSELLP